MSYSWSTDWCRVPYLKRVSVAGQSVMFGKSSRNGHYKCQKNWEAFEYQTIVEGMTEVHHYSIINVRCKCYPFRCHCYQFTNFKSFNTSFSTSYWRLGTPSDHLLSSLNCYTCASGTAESSRPCFQVKVSYLVSHTCRRKLIYHVELSYVYEHNRRRRWDWAGANIST